MLKSKRIAPSANANDRRANNRRDALAVLTRTWAGRLNDRSNRLNRVVLSARQIHEKEGVRLVKVPVSGGAEEPIPLRSDLRLAPVNMGSKAIAKDGRALLTIAAPDSWFYGAAIFDPRSGKLDRIPLKFTGDMLGLGWAADGRILASGWPTKGRLWRFRSLTPEKK